MQTTKDFEEFFASFNKHAVEYLVVGGYAFALHAHPRFTGDLDVFVGSSAENGKRIVRALEDFGFTSQNLNPADFTKEGKVIQLGRAPIRIDILTGIDGVGFSEAWSRKVEGSYGTERVWFISKPDLIANKRASGRERDLLDLNDLLTPES